MAGELTDEEQLRLIRQAAYDAVESAERRLVEATGRLLTAGHRMKHGAERGSPNGIVLQHMEDAMSEVRTWHALLQERRTRQRALDSAEAGS